MKEKIQKLCKQIEKKYKIKILFAIENGSRAWRMESENSDYDVRFVFMHPKKEYLQLTSPTDVINETYDKQGNPCQPEGAFIDIVGFDIFKFCKLLTSSNPTTIEWLISDIVYLGKQNKALQTYARKQFHPVALYFHYQSMCKNNYLKYIKSKQEVTYKKYLYALRGLVNATWVFHKKSIPPIKFTEALDGLQETMPESVRTKVKEIIALKKEGKEKDIVQNIVQFDQYIEHFLKLQPIFPEQQKKNIESINKELQKLLK